MSQIQTLKDLQEMISSIERTLFAMRGMVAELSGEKPLMSSDSFLQQSSQGITRMGDEGKIVEGGAHFMFYYPRAESAKKLSITSKYKLKKTKILVID